MEKTKTIEKRKNIIDMEETISLVLPSSVISQISVIHSMVTKGKEWSGVLLYKVIEGDIDKPSEMKLRAEYIYPMDIGSSGATAYQFDEKIMDMYDAIPEAMDLKVGLVHSHNTMNTFFSGTDLDELSDNAQNYNYYLSLIVNYAGRYSAKVAVYSKGKDSVVEVKTNSGELKDFTIAGKELIMAFPVNVTLEENSYIFDKIKEIKETKAKEEAANKTNGITGFDYRKYNQWGGNGYNAYKQYQNDDDDFDSTPYSRNINIVNKKDEFIVNLDDVRALISTAFKTGNVDTGLEKLELIADKTTQKEYYELSEQYIKDLYTEMINYIALKNNPKLDIDVLLSDVCDILDQFTLIYQCVNGLIIDIEQYVDEQEEKRLKTHVK